MASCMGCIGMARAWVHGHGRRVGHDGCFVYRRMAACMYMYVCCMAMVWAWPRAWGAWAWPPVGPRCCFVCRCVAARMGMDAWSHAWAWLHVCITVQELGVWAMCIARCGSGVHVCVHVARCVQRCTCILTCICTFTCTYAYAMAWAWPGHGRRMCGARDVHAAHAEGMCMPRRACLAACMSMDAWPHAWAWLHVCVTVQALGTWLHVPS
jgi:hypothetical protein